MAFSSAPTVTASPHTTAMSRVTEGNLGRGIYSGFAPLTWNSLSKASSAQYSSPSTPKFLATVGCIWPRRPTSTPPTQMVAKRPGW